MLVFVPFAGRGCKGNSNPNNKVFEEHWRAFRFQYHSIQLTSSLDAGEKQLWNNAFRTYSLVWNIRTSSVVRDMKAIWIDDLSVFWNRETYQRPIDSSRVSLSSQTHPLDFDKSLRRCCSDPQIRLPLDITKMTSHFGSTWTRGRFSSFHNWKTKRLVFVEHPKPRSLGVDIPVLESWSLGSCETLSK